MPSTPTSTRTRVRAVTVVAAGALAAGLGTVTYTASAAETAAPARPAPAAAAIPALFPPAIAPPKGSRPIGAWAVQNGTQTYTCRGGTFTGASVPEARLIGGPGGRLHHFAGPSWQSERDGSLVTAAKKAESPRAGTIPELLLEVTGHSGPATGILAKATHIQRLRTSGGIAPGGSCTDGSTTAVPYGALYVFWAA
jgi:hypothetical protein